MTVTCKVCCKSKSTDMEGNTHVRMQGVYEHSSESVNKAISDHPPQLEFVLTIAPDKPAADYYVQGREYLVDFKMIAVAHTIQVDPLELFGEPT